MSRRPTGQEKFEIFAEGAREFFAKAADIQITFQVDAHGQASAIVVHQGGVDTPTKRIQ
jgi:hypothetical protein